MVERRLSSNSGRGCINCSGSGHRRTTNEIAGAMAEPAWGPSLQNRRSDPAAHLAAFTVPGAARRSGRASETGLTEDGVADMRPRSFGPRLVEKERCGDLRPTVASLRLPEPVAGQHRIHVPVRQRRQCPQEEMIEDRAHVGIQRDHRDKKWQQQA